MNSAGDLTADDGQCTIREAIQAAQTNSAQGPGGPTIDCPAGQGIPTADTIQVPAGTFSMAGAPNEDLNASGDFDISFGLDPGPLVIDGVLGANDVPETIIDAADQDRIFDVQVLGNSRTTIREMILRRGKPPEANSDGGAILIRDDDARFTLETARVEDSDALRWGGGMANIDGDNDLDIKIIQTEFSGNDAVDDGGAVWADGPPNNDSYVIERSALVNNHSDTMGGGIYVRSDPGAPDDEPVVEIENTTMSGNSADLAGGAAAFAFGTAGTIWFRFSTIAGNTTPVMGAGGGISTNSGSPENQFVLFQGGTIISDNLAAGLPSNCVGPGTFDSLGYNLESTDSCGLDQTTDLVDTNPLLAALALNGGGDLTTRTRALGTGSQAIDRIPSANCNQSSGVDQRGVVRPVGPSCDVGAYETTAPPAGGSPGTPGTTPPKKCKKKKKKKKGKSGASAAKKKKKGCKKKKKKK